MEFLEGINWGLLAPLFIVQLILLVVSLVDLSRIEKTNGPKLLWVFIIIFVNIIGPILYFVIGRRNN
ncbi:PLDc N-terminal domain-containing protein [Neobacillus niacini]|uniref:PLDc N-terminal domain-containing protein n=1 Tax=Neobacillus niacini TaxID=86668 RepID=UPI00203F7AC2|nr:PLDc N-terminal domain-containing protein [Neobacillus niacini]MCM3692672.1 PLDc N-terminal domain-containing protein [Neobacillus niacini]